MLKRNWSDNTTWILIKSLYEVIGTTALYHLSSICHVFLFCECEYTAADANRCAFATQWESDCGSKKINKSIPFTCANSQLFFCCCCLHLMQSRSSTAGRVNKGQDFIFGENSSFKLKTALYFNHLLKRGPRTKGAFRGCSNRRAAQCPCHCSPTLDLSLQTERTAGSAEKPRWPRQTTPHSGTCKWAR